MPEWIEVLNTSFKEFEPHHGDHHLTVPVGWVPVFVHDEREGYLDQPEYKDKDSDRGEPEVRTPPKSASFGTAFATHRAALVYSLFDVKAGQRIKASVWAMSITRDRDGNVGKQMGETIGIGATTDLEDAEYGEWWSADVPNWREREWEMITYEGTAPADDPYLFLRGDANLRLKSNYHIFDDVLVLAETSEPPPEPPPTGDLAKRIEDVAALIGTHIAGLQECQFELYAIAALVGNGCPPAVRSELESIKASADNALEAMG